MKKFILLAFFTIIGISNIVQAQTGTFSVKDYGAKGDGIKNKNAGQGTFSTNIRCEDWQARQIGRLAVDREGSPSPVVYFRKEFNLEKIPATAVLHITADFSFKVYVNGSFVGDGPPRTTNGTPGIYCSYDISSLLTGGANALAVKVFSNGGNPQLTGQLEFRDDRDRITDLVVTDESWKALASPWGVIEHSGGPMGDHTEVFNGRMEPQGWEQAGFDDSKWDGVQASLARDHEASILPHYVRSEALPQRIVFTGEVTDLLGSLNWASPGIQMAMEIPLASKHTRVINAEGLLDLASGVAIIENEVDVRDQASYDSYWDKHEDMPMLRAATIILDFGNLANGFMSIDVEASEGTVVDIGWGQTLVDGRVHTMPRFVSGFMTYASRYFHGGGRRQWETYHWQSFRYLQLTIRNQSGPVKLHRVTAVRSGQPLQERGSFHCSDPFLDRLFVSTGRTLKAASYDFFLDNTIREKRVWGGDIADGSVMSCLPVYGDIAMLRYYFETFGKTQEVIGTGNIPNVAIALVSKELTFLGHNLRTMIQMAEYGFWCSDPDYYRGTIWPILERYLEYLASRVEDRGLLNLMEGEKHWVDHCFGSNFAVRRDNADISMPINLFYLHLLDRASVVAEAYGENSLAEDYRKRAEKIRRAVSLDFWDEEAGLYRDGSYRGELYPNFSTHANYLALVCGLGREGRTERILDAINDPANAGKIIDFNAPFYAWPPAGLFAVGKDQAALDLMRRRYERFYRNPDGGDTFWEEESWALGRHTWESRYRSLAQNGAGSPAWYLLREVLGVKPLKPGFAEFAVEPKPCDLEWAEGVVPSPAGNIPVRWEINEGKMQLNITVPQATKAKVILPGSDKTKTLGPGKHSLKGKL